MLKMGLDWSEWWKWKQTTGHHIILQQDNLIQLIPKWFKYCVVLFLKEKKIEKQIEKYLKVSLLLLTKKRRKKGQKVIECKTINDFGQWCVNGGFRETKYIKKKLNCYTYQINLNEIFLSWIIVKRKYVKKNLNIKRLF